MASFDSVSSPVPSPQARRLASEQILQSLVDGLLVEGILEIDLLAGDDGDARSFAAELFGDDSLVAHPGARLWRQERAQGASQKTSLVMLLEPGLAAGVDFGVAFVPDFVRPGHAVSDFRDPAKTVIGACDRRASALVERVYSVFDPLPTLTTITIAEMMKTIDGAWQVAGRPFAAAAGSVRHPFGIAAATAEPVRPIVPAAAFGPSAAAILVPPEEEVEVEDDPGPAEDAPVCQLQQVMEIVAQARSWAPVRVGIVGLPLKAGAPGDSAIFDVIAELKECGIDVAVHDEDVTTVLPFVDDIAMRRHSGPTLRALAFTLDDMMMPTAQDVAEWADVLILARPCALHDIGAVDCRLNEAQESGAGPQRFAARAGLIPIIDACALDDAGPECRSH